MDREGLQEPIMRKLRKCQLNPGKRYSFKFYYEKQMDDLILKRKLANDTQVLALREIITRWGSKVVEFD